MKRTTIAMTGAAFGALILVGGAPAAQAADGHHHKATHQESKPAKHHGHKDCVCTPKPHKPGHVSCKPNCLGHGPKPCPPTKPPVKHHPHKPHHPKPPVKPPHHHQPKPPVVKPPTVTPRPPIVTPAVPAVHTVTPHARVRLTTTPTSSSMSALPRTGMNVTAGVLGALGCIGGGMLLQVSGRKRASK